MILLSPWGGIALWWRSRLCRQNGRVLTMGGKAKHLGPLWSTDKGHMCATCFDEVK